MITIHEKIAQKFDTLGLGALLPSSCAVTEELNGAYELKMSHPYDEGRKWKRIERGRIIYASTPRGMQPFRIYNTKPNMSGIEVNARHIFYDLLDNQCSEISFNGTASGALSALQGAFAFTMPFSFTTDISVSGTLETGRMNPVQALLSDDDETTSFVKGFGGELLRDGFEVSLLNAIGQERDVAIRYGKNLVGLDVTEDEADVKTRILCYGSDGSIAVDSPYLNEYVYPKIYTLEDEDKTVAELKAEAKALFDGGADIPLVNIKVDFITLVDTVEYADYAPLEEVFLGDIVTIINQKMNFAKKARVISYEWDCLLENYNEVELGDFMPTLASSVTSGVRSGSLASAAVVGTSAVSAALQAHLNDFNNPHKTQAGGGSSLPEVTTEDDGKVLMVDAGIWSAQELEKYLGEYEVTPSTSAVVLSTANLLMSKDVTINAIPESYTDEIYKNGYEDGYVAGSEDSTPTTSPYKCELEWIQSSGAQYIDTGFIPNNNTRVVASYKMMQPSNSVWYKLWGSGNGSYNNDFSAWAKGTTSMQHYYGAEEVTNASIDGGIVEIDANKNTWTYEGVTDTYTVQTFTCDYPMYIFSINKDNNSSYVNGLIRLYYFKIYDDDNLVRDFIPALDWNNIPCLYDKVNGVFYYNAGEGTFNHSEGYTVIDYIQSSGSQYLDTGVSIDANTAKLTKVVIDTQFTDINAYSLHGVGWGASPYYNSFYVGVDGSDKIAYANGRTDMTTSYAYDFTRKTFVYDAPNGKVSVTGFDDITFTFQSPTEALKFLLFAYNQGTNGIKYNHSRIYAAKIYVSEILIRDYIPVLDMYGVPCLYDKVNKEFYYNQGTGGFDYEGNPTIRVNSITTTGSYNSSTYHGDYWVAIDASGNLLLVVEGGTSTSYEAIYFTASSVPSGVSLTAKPNTTDTSATSGACYGCVFSGITGSVDITLNFNSVNSSNDYTQCAVTIKYV